MSSDYSKGKIYKLYIKGFEEVCYVGSTTETLVSRKSKHDNSARYDSQTKPSSCLLYEEGNEVEIELIEDFPCALKVELETRERYWIEKFPDCINKNIPTRGWKERWIKNHEHNLALHRKWLEDNKEAQVEYRAEHRERENAHAQERYKDGYGAIRNERKKEKVECPTCKKVMNKNSLWEHKNKVHKDK
jgi:hypothetical protein